MAIEFNTNTPMEPLHVEGDQTPADAPTSDQNPPQAANQPQDPPQAEQTQPQDPPAEEPSQALPDAVRQLMQGAGRPRGA